MSSTNVPQTGTPTQVSAPQVFSRSASGLVRDLSMWDAMWFGVLSSGLFFSFVFFFPYPQFISPHINTWLMLVISTVATVPIVICYAGLGSAMPRAGGDYLFESRSIAPIVGFTIPFGWAALMWTIFFPLTATVFITSGLAPILNSLGSAWNAGAFTSVATWLGTTFGTLVTTLALSALAWALTVRGVAVYRKIQRWVFVPAIFITFFAFLIVLLFTSHSSFINDFNSFPANKAAGVTAAKVMATATAAGWKPAGFNLNDTLLWVPIMMGVVPFAVFASEGMLGEVKGARNFRRMAGTFMLGAVVIGVFVMALIYFLFQGTAGRNFISAASYVSNTGKLTIPVGVNMATLTTTVSSSPLLAIAIGVGFMASAFQLMTGIFMNISRMLVSMGLDRSLPSRFAAVHQRTHTPVFAATVYLILVAATTIFFVYDSNWYTPLTYSAAVSGEGILLFGCLAAFLLPIRNPQIYASSPIARYKLLGIPLLQVAGAVGFIILGVSWVVIMTNDKLGVTGAGLNLLFDPRLVTIVPLFIAAALFLGWRRVEARRGIDTRLAFKEIPPE